ncbi:hypothetical protein [Catenulispora pinisilvae]|uniref:hypothetical protein n=1 Tax=Catenulispora pinisilvae TaxID=2705253 RepID=UPI0018926980|nr:hypothetical protein [Catenulispora pinisilvae]
MHQFWQHDDDLYEFQVMYSLPNDAWSLELTKLGPNGAMLAVALIPDENFTLPVRVILGQGELPLTVLRRFMAEVDSEEHRIGRTVPDLPDLAVIPEPTGPSSPADRDEPSGSR